MEWRNHLASSLDMGQATETSVKLLEPRPSFHEVVYDSKVELEIEVQNPKTTKDLGS